MEEIVEREWQTHVLRLALQRLESVFSGNAIDVFLRSLEGQSAEEIGTALGLSSETVYVLKHRVKKRLTQEVTMLRQELEIKNRNDTN
ncbi:MAG: sigma factor-like helix-turn-helix DNA-binding protein [Planctomycetota bacterium]